MGYGIGTIEVKRTRDQMVIYGLGQTGRGQKYIKAKEVLGVKSMADPQFKAQLEAGMKKIMPARLPLD